MIPCKDLSLPKPSPPSSSRRQKLPTKAREKKKKKNFLLAINRNGKSPNASIPGWNERKEERKKGEKTRLFLVRSLHCPPRLLLLLLLINVCHNAVVVLLCVLNPSFVSSRLCSKRSRKNPSFRLCSSSSSFSTTTELLLLVFFFFFFFFCYPPNPAGARVPSKLFCFSCHKSQEEEETKIVFVFSKTTTLAS